MIIFESTYCQLPSSSIGNNSRNSSIAFLAAKLMVAMHAMVAFAVDIANLVSDRAEMQRSVDATAMAGAWEMIGDQPLSEERG